MFAVNAGCPSLNRPTLPTYGFSLNGFRRIHTQLQTGLVNLHTAIDFSVPFIRDDCQLSIWSEMVEEIKIVLSPAVQVVEHDPIVRPDVHESPAMDDSPISGSRKNRSPRFSSVPKFQRAINVIDVGKREMLAEMARRFRLPSKCSARLALASIVKNDGVMRGSRSKKTTPAGSTVVNRRSRID